ncbi:MAG: type II secretion system F family protein [Acidimicrobiales bacterium]
MRALMLSGLALWAGATLLLSEIRWFRRQALADRVRLYTPGAAAGARGGLLSVASVRDVVGPLVRDLGNRLSRLAGVTEELGARLQRIHAPVDTTGFRLRQLGWSMLGLAAGAGVTVALALPLPVALLFTLGAPVLAFLVLEQSIANQSRSWQRRLFLELPVVSEQLGMLLSSGFSLGAALTRLAARGKGLCGQELALVCDRVRQGLSEVEALREWAARADVDALDRLVSVLALNREAGDLGRLIAEESRSIRREEQRQLMATLERRAQQVWIPVTVATLVPGVIFLAVPFIEAMRLFAGS